METEAPVDSFPAPENCDDKWATAKLDRDNQRRRQRGWLFWCVVVICLVFYGVFLRRIVCLETIKPLWGDPYHHLPILLALSGVMPTILPLALLKSVYRSTRGASGLTGMAEELAQLVAAVTKLLRKD